MQRRDFLKITTLTGTAAALSGCEKPAQTLVRFLPDNDLVPGTSEWKPSLCTLCGAGCGLTVRVVQGDAEVVRNGKAGVIKMGLAKKLEGNNAHPINRGKLCARGQAGLQVTYHPDRVPNPLKRIGGRDSGQFEPTTWQDAIDTIAAKLRELRGSEQSDGLRFLVGRLQGTRRVVVRDFLEDLGAPPALIFDPLDEPTLRHANALSFGRPLLPTFDLRRTNYLLCFGADFLGTWNSPVSQAIGYGEMRRGREGRRGKFVQLEQRMSQTGANADEWIPIKTGTEGMFALAVACVIRENKLRPEIDDHATQMIPDWAHGLKSYAPKLIEASVGVPAKTIERIAFELASNPPAVVIIGGAPLAQTNGLFNALSVNALNELLGSVDAEGGIHFSPRPPMPQFESEGRSSLNGAQLVEELSNAKLLFLHNANPVFAAPAAWNIRQTLQKVPFIVSLSCFLDETSQYADLVLPDHAPLESWLDDVPEVGSLQAVMTLAEPAVSPLHDTRSMPDVLLEIRGRISPQPSTKPKNFEQIIKESVVSLEAAQLKYAKSAAKPQPDKFWREVRARGGWWENGAATGPIFLKDRAPALRPEPILDGDADTYPYLFQPYFSQAFLEGSLANLPWMQELPDALSTVMWNSWIEINPKTADKLGIEPGDIVEVKSRFGAMVAPAVLMPAIAGDVVASPFGQGHENFGRYANARGANPNVILAPLEVEGSGALAWAGTRVRLSKVGKGELALFSGTLFERPSELDRR